LKNSPKAVFEQIVSIGTSEDHSKYRKPVFAPGFKSLHAFCVLLSKNPQEEELHQFFVQEPAFLFSLFGTNDDGDLAIISKPKIGIRLVADFALLKFSQGGCSMDLIEIERSSIELFNKSGRPSGALAHAVGQIDDWKSFVDRNSSTFVRETIETAKKLPIYSKGKNSKTGFRLKTAKDIENLWHGFGGFDQAMFRYSVVMGRWALLSDSEKKRLIAYNQKYGDIHTVFTYDQIARQALSRPNIDEW
jgi:Domain of unknown function (DUF4263)